MRRISPTAPRPTTPPAVAVGPRWDDGPPEILAKPAMPRPHIRRHGPLSESRKSLLPSSGWRPRASTNAARDQGFAHPAFRNRNRRMPRISLPSTAPGGPSTGVVGTPLTSIPSKQDQAEAKRAKATMATFSAVQDAPPTCASRTSIDHAQVCPVRPTRPLQFCPRPSSTGQLPISGCGSLSLFQRARQVRLKGLTTSRRRADSAWPSANIMLQRRLWRLAGH